MLPLAALAQTTLMCFLICMAHGALLDDAPSDIVLSLRRLSNNVGEMLQKEGPPWA